MEKKQGPDNKTQFKAALYITGFVIFASTVFYGYQMVFATNFRLNQPDKILHIHTGADFPEVLDSLTQGGYIIDPISFAFLSKLAGVQDELKPGAYKIFTNATNKDIVLMLRRGTQEPVRLTFNNLRLKKELVLLLGDKFEASAEAFDKTLSDQELLKSTGLDSLNIVSLFIPNTYEIYWNTEPSKLIARMEKEYNKFWTTAREEKAKSLGLSKKEVSILASIVEAETLMPDEMPVIAGVYYNRLKTNMRLQADPTVIFGVGDFTIKRVTKEHLFTASPYNTYRNSGLPPGPIRIPGPKSIDAVLDMQKHNYIYFCAKEDFSGYHNFAPDFNTHKKFAEAYRTALNARGIK